MIGQEVLRFLVGIVERSSRLAGWASDLAIRKTMRSTRNRPHPWSTVHDYISWQGLTDRRYLARHLPPLPVAISDPSPDRIRELFRRPAGTADLRQVDLPVPGLRAVPDRRLHPHRHQP